jgi:hypothetical protein
MLFTLLIMTVSCRPTLKQTVNPTSILPALTPKSSSASPLPSVTPTVILPTATTVLPPAFTLSIKGNDCSLDGPLTVPYGEFTIKLIIEEPKLSESGYALVTLEVGKALADLKALPSAEQPDWALRLAGEHQEVVVGTSSRAHDLARMTAAYHGEPFYIVCFHTDPDTGIRALIGAFGPIEVKK